MININLFSFFFFYETRQGKGRTPSYQLPGDNFTYGHVNKWDSEGAGQVALTWVKGKLSGTQRGR